MCRNVISVPTFGPLVKPGPVWSDGHFDVSLISWNTQQLVFLLPSSCRSAAKQMARRPQSKQQKLLLVVSRQLAGLKAPPVPSPWAWGSRVGAGFQV